LEAEEPVGPLKDGKMSNLNRYQAQYTPYVQINERFGTPNAT